MRLRSFKFPQARPEKPEDQEPLPLAAELYQDSDGHPQSAAEGRIPL